MTLSPHRFSPRRGTHQRNAISFAALVTCTHLALAAPDDLAQATLPSVVIKGRHYDNSVGSSDAASQGVIESELLKSRPALRPGEVLEFVPGVIVTQHSGDGKANQYFLRGFNLDHGTDFATTVDGMPVNMPTHAHGQGYSDLNFLIPELVDRIEYRKGPYFATHGDFSSAGAADIFYQSKLDAPFAQVTIGKNGYRRVLGVASVNLGVDSRLIGAAELMGNNGPWTVPEGLHRKNAVLRLVTGSERSGSTVSLMAYEARWTSTDQVPERLINAGSFNGRPFGRFDSLDPSDGGRTSRYSLSGEWHTTESGSTTRVSAYAIHYTLGLFSNFTYALDRPDTGDQFSQQDSRNVFGTKVSRGWDHELAGLAARTEVGFQVRQDRIRLGLFDTQARQILATTRLDRVNETLAGVYGQSEIQLTKWLRSVVGLRADRAQFNVESPSNPANSGRTNAQQISPKLTLVAGPWNKTEFFFNAGRGFHSNDARGTTIRVDPKSGDPVDPVPGLVSSRGVEIGARTEAIPNLQSSVALWRLNFDSELVYVGDAGTTEASGASRRYGLEFNNRWTPTANFFLDADFAFTHARFANGDRIPNSVDTVASVAATVKGLGPWSSSLQWRYLGAGALIEDNSVRSKPASTFNLRISRDLKDITSSKSTVTLDVFNLFNRKVDDIQYFYTSRLPNEAVPVDGRIVHPAEPRSVRVTFRTDF